LVTKASLVKDHLKEQRTDDLHLLVLPAPQNQVDGARYQNQDGSGPAKAAAERGRCTRDMAMQVLLSEQGAATDAGFPRSVVEPAWSAKGRVKVWQRSPHPGLGRPHDGGVHRLLIEDDPAIAAPLTRALIRDGYQVEVAGDGPTGLQGARAGGYDLVVELVQARPAVFELYLMAERG
jgi:hypothetical protein